jgi:hypothetical protein
VSGYERAPWLDEADATPREVLTAALGDAGQADAALAALEAAGYAVAAHVWVATLELAEDGVGWVGAHVSRQGAEEALVSFCQRSGVEGIDEYDADTGAEELDEHPAVASYGVSYLPVQR